MWYQTYAHLYPYVAFFLWHGVSSLTRSTYRTGQKSFTDFIALHLQFRNTDGSVLPASQTALLEWVTWISSIKRIQPKTIKLYITHLQSAPVNAEPPFMACKSPLLKWVIRGFKQYLGKADRKPKFPITSEVLEGFWMLHPTYPWQGDLTLRHPLQQCSQHSLHVGSSQC